MHFLVGTILAGACFLAVSKSASGDTSLFEGKVNLPTDNITLTGDKYWQSENDDSRGYVYYGYKYGKAGRFEDSVPNTDFSYLNNASRLKAGHVCPHKQWIIEAFPTRNLSMDEDCLYLDVYVPPANKTQGNRKWPVLFWIYGGGFKMGDKDMYNATLLTRAVDAIVVTVNYRLSAFGFLSTGDEAARGNWAIGDVKLALNWTFANIAAFNGDPEKITIFGESAGGAMVSALMLDDDVRERVFAAVAMSGTIIRPWAVRKHAKEGITRLAASLGCSTESSATMVACLKTVSVDQILNASINAVESGGTGMFYSPVIDGKHLRKEPAEILKDRAGEPASKKVGNYISGYLTEDAALFTIMTPHLINATFNVTLVGQVLAGFIQGMSNTGGQNCSRNIPPQVQRLMAQYNVSEADSPHDLRYKYYRITTDMMFGLGSMAESILYANASPGKNQQYIISYDPGFRNIGSFHFLEILHLFRGPLDSFLKADMSDAFTNSFREYFRQIAYNGRADGPTFGTEGKYAELDQNVEWVHKQQDYASLIKFYKELEEMPCEN